jgi:hypothetical protein
MGGVIVFLSAAPAPLPISSAHAPSAYNSASSCTSLWARTHCTLSHRRCHFSALATGSIPLPMIESLGSRVSSRFRIFLSRFTNADFARADSSYIHIFMQEGL